MKKKYIQRFLIFTLLFTLVLSTIPGMTFATSSSSSEKDAPTLHAEEEAVPLNKEETSAPQAAPLGPSPRSTNLDPNLQGYLSGPVSYSVMRDGIKIELVEGDKIFPGEALTLSLSFKIPNDVTFSAGDTTEIAFSSGLHFDATGEYLPMSGEWAELAEYRVTNPGTITLRFKQSSEGVSNISGSIQLTSKVQAYEAGKDQIKTQLGTLEAKIFRVVEDNSSLCTKANIEKTQTGYDPKTKQVTWLVKIHSTDNQPLDGLRFIDVIGENHSFVSMSHRVGDTGHWTAVTPSPSADGKTLTYTFPSTGEKTAQFTVITKLDDGFIDGITMDKFVTNTGLVHRYNARLETPAWLEIAKSEATNRHTFTLFNNKSYEKVSVTADNRIKISYVLTLNLNHLMMPAGWTVKDELTQGRDFAQKIEGVEIQNMVVKAETTQLTPGTDYTLSYKSVAPNIAPFELTFREATDKRIRVTYDALFTVDELKKIPLEYGKYFIRNILTDQYSKDATINTGINLDDLGLGTMPRVSKNILKVIPGATEADQRIQWESIINLDYKTVTEEATITDGMWSYYAKGKLDSDSIQVYTKKETDADWTPQGKLSQWSGAKDCVFTGNTTFNGNQNTPTPMFSFKVAPETLSNTQIRLVYETPFILIPTANLVTHALENRISLSIGGETIEAKKRASTHLGHTTHIKKNGNYDPLKEEFLWNISLTHKPSNPDGSSISVSYYNPTIKDLALPPGHTLVANSVKVTKDGVPIQVAWEEKDGGLLFKFDRLDPGHRDIVYDVSFATKPLDNSWVQTTATNTARATLVSNTETESKGHQSAIEATATVNVDKTVNLNKKTNYSTGEIVTWEVDITPEENAYISGEIIKLTDKLPPQLTFNAVVELKDMTTGLTAAAPIAEYDGKTNTVTFTLPEGLDRTHTYRLIFETNVVTDQALISNNITLSAAAYSNTTKSNLIYLRKTNSSGTITGDNAGLILLKQNETGQHLNGATFLLTQKELATGDTETREISITQDGHVTLTDLRYGTTDDLTTNSGYEYTLTEKTPPDGYLLSNEKWIIQVGKLNAEHPELTKFWINGKELTTVRAYDGKPYGELTVVNHPAPQAVSLKLDAQKTVNGETPKANEIFTFDLKEVDADGKLIANGQSQTVQNSGSEISFRDIQYNLSDANKTYYYRISEQATLLKGYTIDATAYTVKADISTDADGKLKVTSTVTKNNEPAPLPSGMVFANQYEKPVGNLSLGKTVTGEEGDLAKDFTFTVTFSDNGTYDYTGSKNGRIKSGETITLRHDQRITIVKLPVDTTYTIVEKEANQDGYTTTATNASGKIAEGITANASFVNHKPAKPVGNLSLGKTVTGEEGDLAKDFTFTVTFSDNGTYDY
ncbi:MAG: FctA domain-containing protein, partial [Anaerovoracaceae bacterium]